MSPIPPVRLLAFAGARDLLGGSEFELAVDGPCTVRAFWPLLLARFPVLLPYKSSLRLAVNSAYAEDEDVVAPGDEVAIIPPVAGG